MRLSRFIPAAFAVMAFLPELASAQQVQFLGPKFNSMQLGNQFDPGPHPFVGPYEMQYTSGGSAFDIYCIDFDNAFSTNAYNARVISFADAVNASLSFNGTDNYTALKRALGTTALVPTVGAIPDVASDYLLRLRIAGALSRGFGPTPASDWDERHYDIWVLFSSLVTPYEVDGTNDAAAIGNAAVAQVFGGYDGSDWKLIIDERAWDSQYTGNLEQTVIAQSVVPEPGTYALVGVGMLVLAGVARRRNRSSRQLNAGTTQLV